MSFFVLRMNSFISALNDGSFIQSDLSLQYFQMMYRLFRKELSLRGKIDIPDSDLSEPLFMEEISRMIKALKKREAIYSRLEAGEQAISLIKQNQEISQQIQNLLAAINAFRSQSFYSRKAYLYSAYMRLSEMIEKGRLRVASLASEINYTNAKKVLNIAYAKQTEEQNYDILALFQAIQNNQNQRLSIFFPKKRQRPLSPLSSKGLLQKLRMPQSSFDLKKKSMSTQLLIKIEPDVKLEQALNRKLGMPQLATLKRVDQRKIEKPKPRVINLFKLYDILSIRPPIIDKPYGVRTQLQASMTERNQIIKQSIKKWQKRYCGRKGMRKDSG